MLVATRSEQSRALVWYTIWHRASQQCLWCRCCARKSYYWKSPLAITRVVFKIAMSSSTAPEKILIAHWWIISLFHCFCDSIALKVSYWKRTYYFYRFECSYLSLKIVHSNKKIPNLWLDVYMETFLTSFVH